MKKKNYFLSTLLVIFLVGILLTVVGVCSGGRLFSYETTSEDMTNDQTTSGLTTLSDVDAETITGLDFDFKADSVKIILGDQYSIESTGQYESYVKDGKWYVKTAYSKTYISFLSRKIIIPAFWEGWNETEGKLTVTIPANTRFTSANIKMTAGDIHGDVLEADKIDLKAGAGELNFKELSAQEMTLKVGAGDANFNKFCIEESCDIKVGAGEINLGSEDNILSENVIANLNGECAAGEIYIAGKLTGDADLDCATGEIDLLLDGNRNNYNINTSGALAEINVENSTEFTNKESSDDSQKNKEQFANISLDCSLGEINVDFEE